VAGGQFIQIRGDYFKRTVQKTFTENCNKGEVKSQKGLWLQRRKELRSLPEWKFANTCNGRVWKRKSNGRFRNGPQKLEKRRCARRKERFTASSLKPVKKGNDLSEYAGLDGGRKQLRREGGQNKRIEALASLIVRGKMGT